MTSRRLTIAVSESKPVRDSQSASSGARRLPNTAIRCFRRPVRSVARSTDDLRHRLG